MGIENRDYVRNDDRPGSGAPMSEYPAVRTIIVITVVIYLAQIFITRPVTSDDIRQMYPRYEDSGQFLARKLNTQQPDSKDNDKSTADNGSDEALEIPAEFEHYIQQMFPKTSVPENWFQLDTDKVLKRGQVWRLLTSAFCHDRLGVWHILINMIMLFWFGRELETIYGTRSFAWFYVTAAIVSALAFIGIQLVTGERVPAIGASGAVMAVMMIYSIFHPRDEIYLFFVIPIQIRFLLLFYIIYDLHPLLLQLAGTPVSTGIAHAAHLGGLLYGYLFWRSGISLLGLWDRTAAARSRIGRRQGKRGKRSKSNGAGAEEPRILPMRGPYANSKTPGSKTSDARETNDGLDQQVDRILAKISESGRESLNDEEVRILEQASRKYSQRSDS